MTEKEKLQQRQRELAEQMQKLNEQIGQNAPTDEQRAEWDKLDDEARQNEQRLTELAEIELRVGRVAEHRAKWGTIEVTLPKEEVTDVRTAAPGAVVSRARRVLDEDTEGTDHLTERQKKHVSRLLRTVTGDTDGVLLARLMVATETPEYRSAFQKLIHSKWALLTQEEARAAQQVEAIQRAMSIGTPSAGGYAVPVLLDPTIILVDQESGDDITRLARVEQITNDTWRGLTAQGMSWKWDGERAPSTDNSPSIDKPEVKTHRADGFIPYSIEVAMDWGSFASTMATLMAEGFSDLVAQTLTTGSGANTPDGVLPQALAATPSIKQQVATSATLSAGDFYDLWAALPKKWRRRPTVAWMASTSVEGAIRQLGDTDPNFTVSIRANGVPDLFGKEFVTNDFFPDMPTGTSSDALALVGDWKQYLIAQRMGMTVEPIQMIMDPTTGYPKGERGMVGYARLGAKLIVPDAFRVLVNK